MQTYRARQVANGLAVLGAAATVTSIVVEITDRDAHAELVAGLVGGVTLILASMVLRGGEDRIRHELLLAGAIAFVFGVAGLSRLAPARTALLLYIPAVAAFGVMFGWSRRAAREQASVTRERRRARIEGEERERERWARELHDDTLQELGAMRVLLASAAAGGNPAAMRSAIEGVNGLLSHQIATLRHLIDQVRPLALDQLGLLPALRSLAEQTTERTGIRVTVSGLSDADAVPGSERLPAEIEGAVYRIVQEGLANAAKHSRASAVEVAVSIGADRTVEVAVRDDGVGLPARISGSGLGLLGMRERAAMLGGTLATSTDRRTGGTTIRAVLPLPG